MRRLVISAHFELGLLVLLLVITGGWRRRGKWEESMQSSGRIS
jgi:hypothetical protein